MVDLGNLTGGSDDDDDKKKKKEQKKKKQKAKKDAKKQIAEEKSDGEKLEEFKGNVNKKTKSDNIAENEIESMLYALANPLLYLRGMETMCDEKLEKTNSKKYRIQKAMVTECLEQITKMYSLYNIHRIAEKHGYDWEEDVMFYVMENQDEEELMGIK